MTDGNLSQEFRFKKIDERRNYFIQEIKQNGLISKKHKKVCTILNYTKHLLILASTVTGCVSISAIAFLVGIIVDIASIIATIKFGIKTAGIKKYKSKIQKKKKKHEKIVLLTKASLSNVEFLNSKVLIESIINSDEFILVSNVCFNK